MPKQGDPTFIQVLDLIGDTLVNPIPIRETVVSVQISSDLDKILVVTGSAAFFSAKIISRTREFAEIKIPGRFLHQHRNTQKVGDEIFGNENFRLATLSTDEKKITIFNNQGEEVRSFSHPTKTLKSFFPRLFISESNDQLITNSSDYNLWYWTSPSANPVPLKTGEPFNVYFAPTGPIFVIRNLDSSSGILRIKNLSGHILGEIPINSELFQNAYFSLDGKYLIILHQTKSPEIWTLSGRKIQTLGGNRAEPRFGIAFNIDNNVIAVSKKNSVQLWFSRGSEMGQQLIEQRRQQQNKNSTGNRNSP